MSCTRCPNCDARVTIRSAARAVQGKLYSRECEHCGRLIVYEVLFRTFSVDELQAAENASCGKTLRDVTDEELAKAGLQRKEPTP